MSSCIEIFSGYIHDAVLLWAYGVNRTMRKGFPPDHHLEVIKSILGFKFEGVTGTVSVDSQGDRMNDYDVTIAQNGRVSWWLCASNNLKNVK